MQEILANQSTTLVETSQPNKYINRLCRHFSHKVDANWEEGKGVIVFTIGECRLSAEPLGMRVECNAPDAEQLAELKEVLKSHFDRFAVQDNLVMFWPASETDVTEPLLS